MPRLVLLVGTRKGCFVLESDGDRRDWKVRGPFCDGWPIYHAVHDPTSGALYAAAASEWHGAGVWRSNDLGETWTLSSEGLTHSNPELQALQDLGPDGGPRAASRRHGGGRHLREPRRRRDLVAAQHTRRANPGATTGTTPTSSRRGTSGYLRSCPTRTSRRTSGP